MMVNKLKLKALAELNGFKWCGEERCTDFPHGDEENRYHVPCAMCGLPRSYLEVRDWQTQDEMGKMCSGCLDEAYGDRLPY